MIRINNIRIHQDSDYEDLKSFCQSNIRALKDLIKSDDEYITLHEKVGMTAEIKAFQEVITFIEEGEQE